MEVNFDQRSEFEEKPRISFDKYFLSNQIEKIENPVKTEASILDFFLL
jgi:hypothetical protein